MDDADRAQIHSEALLASIMASRPGPAAGESATVCDECGEDIPEARRAASPGCRLCLECQQEMENQRR